MRKKTGNKQGKSLKTFFIYTALVLIVVTLSLLVKFFFVVRASKFDSSHQFTVAFLQNRSVKEIYISNPDTQSQVILMPQGKPVSATDISKNYFIIPDATVTVPQGVTVSQNVSQTLSGLLWHYPLIQTDLTLYDLIRLYIFTSGVPPANTTVQSISAPLDTTAIGTLLSDNSLSDENIPIQIINATDVTGLGSYLAQILSLMGGNVVDVSTAQNDQNNSVIEYYGDKTYTLQKMSQLLSMPIEKLTTQPIANIVIIIGQNAKIISGY